MNFNATLIGQIVAFAVFVAFCMRYVWPPLLAAMQEREQRIAKGLAAGQEAEEQLQAAKQEHQQLIVQAKQEASQIVSQANKRREEILEDARVKATSERDLVLKGAEAEMHRRQEKAREDLRKQVANLAIIGAEKILEREVNANDHRELLQKVSQML